MFPKIVVKIDVTVVNMHFQLFKLCCHQHIIIKVTLFFLKMLHFLSLNIRYAFYILLRIKQRFMRFANHCIVFFISILCPNLLVIGVVLSIHVKPLKISELSKLPISNLVFVSVLDTRDRL